MSLTLDARKLADWDLNFICPMPQIIKRLERKAEGNRELSKKLENYQREVSRVDPLLMRAISAPTNSLGLIALCLTLGKRASGPNFDIVYNKIFSTYRVISLLVDLKFAPFRSREASTAARIVFYIIAHAKFMSVKSNIK